MQRAMVAGFDRLDDWRLVRDRLNVEHEQIVVRIEAHDPDGARAAVRDHILGFYRQTFGEISG
jgi:DNA-binding GntR family transcriptional regulator